MPRRRSPDGAPAAAQRRGGTTLTPTSGNPPSGGEEGPDHIRETLPAQLKKRYTRQLQPPWHYRRKRVCCDHRQNPGVRLRHTHQSQRADGLRCEDRADVRTKLSTLFTVARPKARHNHPMTVRCFETADGRTVEHGQFGGFPEVGDLEAERQLADVLVGAAAERPL